jgi:hypothetical protein
MTQPKTGGWRLLQWGSGQINGMSTSGVPLLLYGNPVTWSTEKQTHVVHSTSGAKYIAITLGLKEAKYFINLMQVEMKLRVTPIRSRVEHLGSGYMAEQSVTNKNQAYQPAFSLSERGDIRVQNFEMDHVATKANTSDIITKSLDRGLFEVHRDTLRSRPPYVRISTKLFYERKFNS